jgi:NAD(P)H dehydrogenase (quinone)
MPRLLIVYHSLYGHVARLAAAAALGASEVVGTEVVTKRVPELVSERVIRRAGGKLQRDIPVVKVAELAEFDAILFGARARLGNMSAPMRAFLDASVEMRSRGALVGKLGGAFVSVTNSDAGQDLAMLGLFATLLQHGMIVVGLPREPSRGVGYEQLTGASPFGATTVVGSRGERLPSEQELDLARRQGAHLANVAKQMRG